MASLSVIGYYDTANDGNYDIAGKKAGKVVIATLSTTSQRVAIPAGSKFVRVVSDATVRVYFDVGGSSVAATVAASDELASDQEESVRFIGCQGCTHLAAILA